MKTFAIKYWFNSVITCLEVKAEDEEHAKEYFEKHKGHADRIISLEAIS